MSIPWSEGGKFGHLFLPKVAPPLQITHRWRKGTIIQDDGLFQVLSCNLFSFNVLHGVMKTKADRQLTVVPPSAAQAPLSNDKNRNCSLQHTRAAVCSTRRRRSRRPLCVV